MTVDEMLNRISSYELTQWDAYERATGPLGGRYSDETLAAIQEQLQLTCYLLGAQWEENPAPQPKPWPRAAQVTIDPAAGEEESPGEEVGGADELSAFFDDPRNT
jgi:hypothetical protein